MRDQSFTLEPAAPSAQPPFSYRFIDRPWPAATWSIRSGDNAQIGRARTRAGARAGVRALYAAAAAGDA